MSGTAGGRKPVGLMERLHAQAERAVLANGEDVVEALLKARARRLAQPRAAESLAPAGLDVLSFQMGAERYAAPLNHLAEASPLGAWTPVPGQPQYLLGVTNLRGEIRPVIDFHALLGLPGPAEDARCWVIFLKNGGTEVGLRIDAFESIKAIDPASLTRPVEAGNGLPQRFIAGIGPDALILIDIPQILALDALVDSRADLRLAP